MGGFASGRGLSLRCRRDWRGIRLLFLRPGRLLAHLEHYLALVAKIDRGEARILRLPFGKVLLVVVPAVEEVRVAEVKQQLVAVPSDNGGHERLDVLRIGDVNFAQLAGELLVGGVDLGDEMAVYLHARGPRGWRVVGSDSGDDGERIVLGGHRLRGHAQSDSVAVGEADIAAVANEGDRRALADGEAELVGKQAHDGRRRDPGQVLEFGAALGERDEENVAAHIAAEDAEKLGLGHLRVAEDLDIF